MKVIIAGGRDITDYELVLSAVSESQFDITEVVSGGASGVDTLAIVFAMENNIPSQTFMANWTKYGNAAGPIRNRLMADNAEALIAIWDGKSRGTKNMIEEAKKRNLKVFIKYL